MSILRRCPPDSFPTVRPRRPPKSRSSASSSRRRQTPFRVFRKRGADGKIVTHRQRLIKRGILKHYADAPLERLHVFSVSVPHIEMLPPSFFKQAALSIYCRAFSRAVYAEKAKSSPRLTLKLRSRTARISPKDFVRFLISMIFCIVFFLSDRRLFYVCRRSDGEGYHTINIVPCKVRLSICFCKIHLAHSVNRTISPVEIGA